MKPCMVDLLIARIARVACSAETGQRLAADDLTRTHHDGASKAYRDAIRIVIEAQRRSRSLALASEQCASCMNAENDSRCVMLTGAPSFYSEKDGLPAGYQDKEAA